MKNLLLVLLVLTGLASAGTLTITVDSSAKSKPFSAIPRAIVDSKDKNPVYYFISSKASKIRAIPGKTQIWYSSIDSAYAPRVTSAVTKDDFDAVVVDFAVHPSSDRHVSIARHCKDTGLIKDTGALYSIGPLPFKDSNIIISFFDFKGTASNYSVDCSITINKLKATK